MKLTLRSTFYVLFFSFMAVACGGEEDDGSGTGSNGVINLKCGNTMTNGFQCISAAGQSTTTTYKVPELYGTWNSDDFDFCVTYKSDGTGVINYKASGLSPGSTQNIKWGAMVKSNGELIVSNSETNYIIHESLSGDPVDPQIVSLSFKRSTKQWYGFDLVSVSSCPSGSAGTGTGTGNGTGNGTGTGTSNTGSIVFWTDSDQGCGDISVTFNGSGGTITSYYTSGTPDCGDAGCATFSAAPGTYSYSASCDGYQWGPTTVTIEAGSCSTLRLH